MSYINELSIWGLMNKNAFINEDANNLSFYKTKNKKKVVFFEKLSEEEEKNYDIINYMYLDEDPEIKGTTSMEEIISILDKGLFEDLTGKTYKEIRETIHKYRNKIVIKPINKDTHDNIINMIEEWRYLDNGGMKYLWQEHAGIDKAIVKRYIDNDWREPLIGMSFWLDDKCIGYSLCERYASDIIDNKFEYKYLTRKVLNLPGLRNITEYIDWVTFNQVWKNHKIYHPDENEFLINWGCSSGGVHWYKTHKWPVYSLNKKYFLAVKK